MTQNWRNLFHPGLAPLLVVSYLKLNRSRLLISLVRSRSTRQLDMMVWVPKFSNLSHHDLSTYFAGYWTYELQQIPSLINGKLAKLHQTAQRCQQHERNNYRPIIELPILPKIIQKHGANLLLKYLQENNLPYELHSAFHSGHSTEMDLIRITD